VLVLKKDVSSADISTRGFSYVMKGETAEVEVSFYFFFLFCEIEENDDLMGFGVLPLLVSRQTGMRAVWRSTPPRRAGELDWEAGVGERRATLAEEYTCTALTNVSLSTLTVGEYGFDLKNQLKCSLP
jgi:hypothetical protein